MEVKYFIRDFKPLDYLFGVVYYTDYFPQGIYTNLPLPLNAECNAYLESDELHNFIMAYAPYGELRNRERIAVIDTSYIDRMIENQDPSYE